MKIYKISRFQSFNCPPYGFDLDSPLFFNLKIQFEELSILLDMQTCIFNDHDFYAYEAPLDNVLGDRL